MGLNWLVRHLGDIIVWILITATLGLTVTAIAGASFGNTSLANNTGAGAAVVFLAGMIYAGGHAVARRSQRATRLEQLELSVEDVRTRVTRIEEEQLGEVADVLAGLEQTLNPQQGNVRHFRRGS